MLDFFRSVAQTIPSTSPSPTNSPSNETPASSSDPSSNNSARDMLQDRAGIIVLREDLDFYVIPPKPDIDSAEMVEIKRAAGRALLEQNGIFSGLRRSEEAGTTEQHLIEMLTAGCVTNCPAPFIASLAHDKHELLNMLLSGFYNEDTWGHRASEPQKAVICSLALARLRTDIKGNDSTLANNSSTVGMAQKLLLFWRKPARRCWWEGIELNNVEGVQGKLKVWIRRVWTLEMVSLYGPFHSKAVSTMLIKMGRAERNWAAMMDGNESNSSVLELFALPVRFWNEQGKNYMTWRSRALCVCVREKIQFPSSKGGQYRARDLNESRRVVKPVREALLQLLLG